MLYIAIVISLVAGLYASDCYDTSRVEVVLEYDELNDDIIFTSYEDMNASDSIFIMRHHSRWFFRRAGKDTLDEVAFLSYVGLEREAERLALERTRDISRKRLQVAIGVPAGLLLSYGGGWWLANTGDDPGSVKEFDKTFGAVAIASGITLAGIVIWSYLKARKVSCYEHKVTFVQALNTVSRYNNLLRLRCARQE